MATFFSAKNAKVRSGSGVATVTAKKWSVDVDADEIEVSNFEAAGFSDTITGLLRASITIELDLDGASGKNPWDSANTNVYWRPGQDVTSLTLYFNDTSGPSWIFPSARVTKSSNPMDVKQSGQATFMLKNRGTFTFPAGAFGSA